MEWDNPSFTVRAIVIMVDTTRLGIFENVHCPENNRLIIIPIRSIDAVASVKKYFVDASMACGLNFFIRIRIIANMFISKLIQIISENLILQ